MAQEPASFTFQNYGTTFLLTLPFAFCSQQSSCSYIDFSYSCTKKTYRYEKQCFLSDRILLASSSETSNNQFWIIFVSKSPQMFTTFGKVVTGRHHSKMTGEEQSKQHLNTVRHFYSHTSIKWQPSYKWATLIQRILATARPWATLQKLPPPSEVGCVEWKNPFLGLTVCLASLP